MGVFLALWGRPDCLTGTAQEVLAALVLDMANHLSTYPLVHALLFVWPHCLRAPKLGWAAKLARRLPARHERFSFYQKLHIVPFIPRSLSESYCIGISHVL